MSELPELDATDQRILGALMEKQVTVPATYPLTANALRTACNQSNNRDPVVDLDQETVEQTARSLKDRGLLRIVWASTGRRTLKYHQTLEEVLGLDPEEKAILTVLLLRGEQAPGQLRTRTERLHEFVDREEVEARLALMAQREQPLVRELARKPGQQDARWIHLLGPVPESDATAAPVDPDAVIAGGAEVRDEQVVSAYDAVATHYGEQPIDDLTELPFETWLLDRVVAHAARRPVVEVGSGPGHVTAYLASRGADATGIDVSPAMVAEAQRRFPGPSFEVGDLRRLAPPTTAGGWAAVLGWYSLVHLATSELSDAIAALVRPLAPGGRLVLALHDGAGTRRVEEWFGHDVALDFVLHDRAEVLRIVEAAGLVDVEWYLRGQVAARGETTDRLYVIARKPG